MTLEDYKSNSNRSREQEQTQTRPEIRPGMGTVKLQKKAPIPAWLRIFIPGDIYEVREHAVKEMIVPAIKKTVVEAICDSIRMLAGVDRGANNKSDSPYKVSYRQYYKGDSDQNSRIVKDSGEVKGRSYRDFDNFIFSNRGDAEFIKSYMETVIEDCDCIKIEEFYDAVRDMYKDDPSINIKEILPMNYTNAYYGWLTLQNVSVVRYGDGYLIDLPKPVRL